MNSTSTNTPYADSNRHMVSTAKFVGLRARNKQEKSPAELISALKPYIRRALDRAQGNSQSELSIMLRRESDEVHLQETGSEKQRLAWPDNLKPQNQRSKLLEGWEEQRESEMQKVLSYCETVIPLMLSSLRSGNIHSTETILKFRNGKFSWSTEKTESQFDLK